MTTGRLIKLFKSVAYQTFSCRWVFALLVLAALACAIAGETTTGTEAPRPDTRSTPEGRNGREFAEEAFESGQMNLQQQREAMSQLRGYQHFTYPGGELALGAMIQDPEKSSKFVSKFLKYQVLAKVLRVQATLQLLQGKRVEALQTFADIRYFGYLLADSNVLLVRLIGVAVGAISNAGLELYVLNACETPQEIEAAFAELEKLKAATKPAPELDALLRRLELPAVLRVLNPAKPQTEEALVRHRTTDAQFDLIRMAAAAKHRLLSAGSFPSADGEFAPLMPSLPKDPFSQPKEVNSRASLMRYVSDPKGGDFLCYSLGPDQQDEKAQVLYDATNGTVSGGDLIVRVPRERKYPFPGNAVRATSASELRAMFPNGLPADPFANTKGRPLGISDTKPVRVYSFGPDTNESDSEKNPYSPEVQYDPTNGTVSPGDIFLEIPTP